MWINFWKKKKQSISLSSVFLLSKNTSKFVFPIVALRCILISKHGVDDWGAGSVACAPVWQVQNPEFDPCYQQKEKKYGFDMQLSVFTMSPMK